MSDNYPIFIAPHTFGMKNGQDVMFVPLMSSILRKLNPDADIFFPDLNRNQVKLPGIKSIKVADEFIDELKIFDQKYVHLSTNHENFEKFCIKRFFYLKYAFERLEIDKAFIIETDVLPFYSFKEYAKEIEFDPNKTYLSEEKCISTSFVSLSFLDKYCSSIINTYESKGIVEGMKGWFHKYLEGGGKGGICDMVFCQYMKDGRQNFPVVDISDISEVRKSSEGKLRAFDSFIIRKKHVGDDRLFQLESSPFDGKLVKRVDWHGPQPVAYFEDGTEVVMDSLHYQGSAKNLMGLHIANWMS